MQVWSLSSGSSGNCYLVRQGSSALLLDAGISIARVSREMERLGVSPTDLAAVVVSHEHVDHWSSALPMARRFRVPVLCTMGTLEAGASSQVPASLHVPLMVGRPVAVGVFSVEAFSLPHDAREPVGFLVRAGDATMLLATDMGVADDQAIERGRAADLVILEANHDVGMLVRGPYPTNLKSRILGGRGHLSNEQSAGAIRLMAEGRPRQFWLAHLSETNNSPRLAARTVSDWLTRDGLGNLRVAVALRDRPSLFWDSEASLVQLKLF